MISSKAIKRFNGVATIVWVVAVPVVLLIPELQKSLPLLVFISIYANIAGHFSAYIAGRVEVQNEDEV